MRTIILLLILGLFGSSSAVYSTAEKNFLDKALVKFAQSSWVTNFNQILAASYKQDESELQEALEELQKLGKEAQEAVGVPPNRIVSIKAKPMMDGAFAIAGSDSITINSQNSEPYSVQRCNLYHEAVHIKYNDHAAIGVVNLASTAVGLVGGCTVTKLFKPAGGFKLLYPVAALFGAFASKIISDKYYRRYVERRADSEGHYATGCHVCVHDKAEDMHKAIEIAKSILTQNEQYQKEAVDFARNHIESKRSYLSREENEEIASELRKQIKVCVYHESQNK